MSKVFFPDVYVSTTDLFNAVQSDVGHLFEKLSIIDEDKDTVGLKVQGKLISNGIRKDIKDYFECLNIQHKNQGNWDYLNYPYKGKYFQVHIYYGNYNKVQKNNQTDNTVDNITKTTKLITYNNSNGIKTSSNFNFPHEISQKPNIKKFFENFSSICGLNLYFEDKRVPKLYLPIHKHGIRKCLCHIENFNKSNSNTIMTLLGFGNPSQYKNLLLNPSVFCEFVLESVRYHHSDVEKLSLDIDMSDEFMSEVFEILNKIEVSEREVQKTLVNYVPGEEFDFDNSLVYEKHIISKKRFNALKNYVYDHLAINKFSLLNGHEIKSLGIEEGPKIGEIIQRLKDLQISNPDMTKQQAKEFVLNIKKVETK